MPRPPSLQGKRTGGRPLRIKHDGKRRGAERGMPPCPIGKQKRQGVARTALQIIHAIRRKTGSRKKKKITRRRHANGLAQPAQGDCFFRKKREFSLIFPEKDVQYSCIFSSVVA